MKTAFFALMSLAAVIPFLAMAMTALPIKNISMEAKEAGAREMIQKLLEQSGMKYELPSALTNSVKINVDAEEAAWADVFEIAIADAGFDFNIGSDGVLRLTPLSN